MSQGNQGQKPGWAQGSSGGWGGNQGWGGQQGTQGNQGSGQPNQPNQPNQGWGQQGNQGWGGQQGTQGNQQGTQGNQGWGGQQGTQGNQGWGGQQGFNPQQQQQQQQPVTSLFDQNRDYMIFTALDDDYALDVSQGSDSSKYKMILWKKHGEKNQRFRIKPVPGTSKYQIYSNLGATV